MALLAHLKDTWRELSRHPPGRRFRRHYQEKRSDGTARGKATLIIGIALVIAGVLLLAVPGPGTVVIVIGVALLAQRSLLLARLLDRAEVLGRRLWERAARFWRGAPQSIRALLLLLSLGGVAALGWLGYLVLLRP